MERICGVVTKAVAGSQTKSDAVGVDNMAGGVLVPNTTWVGLTELTFEVAQNEGDTHVVLNDKNGSPVTCGVAPGEASEIPEQVFMAGSFKAVGDAAAPAGGTDIRVIFKS